MITPNKFISFDQSILSKLEFLLDRDTAEIKIPKLFEETFSKFDDINEFIASNFS